ncbi:MAG: chromosome segregation protein SMC [Candidatus Omnitrophica bacterium]|nr:chromosome segregation protein SMC [Candidatus Omnitrophota bacterium]
MYLKKIELMGFKSFADRTVISFEKGITAIVGPNGCGKSNISDSIRWVLGEKKAKLLRGGKMEDLIFAGTDFRKPMGFAEVSLTISNEDKLFPIEYEEVVLSRRLYRNGESEYLLNKTVCRLKDIQDLIMNTGIGSNAYSMVEQGEIDHIVQAKPDERRFLIEEAAGISKYKSKKEEALRKLERTEVNLQRVNDIVAEIEKNIKYAERQAKRAESFRKKFDELKTLELVKTHNDLEKISIGLKNLTHERESLSVREREVEAMLRTLHEKLRQIETDLGTFEAEQQSLDERRYELKNELSTMKGTRTFNSEKCAELAKRSETLAADVALSCEKVTSFRADVDARKLDLDTFDSHAQNDRDKLKVEIEKRDSLIAEIEKKKTYVEECQSDIMDITGTITKQRNEYHKLENQRTGITNKKERIRQSLERSIEEEKEITSRISTEQEVVKNILQEYEHVAEQLCALTQERQATEKTLTEIQTALLKKRGLAQELDAKLKVLEELAAALGSFKEGTQALIDESKRSPELYVGIMKSVLELIEVHEGYEYAIQAVLAEELSAVTVNSYVDACRLLEQVEAEEKGSVDILINQYRTSQDRSRSFYNEHILGRASDFVTITDERMSGLRSMLNEVIVVDCFSNISEECIKELAGEYHIVSKKGAVITREGLFKWRAERESSSGILVQEERKNALRKDRELMNSEICVLADEENRFGLKIKELAPQIEHLSERSVHKKITLESNEKMSSSIQENLSKLQDYKGVLTFELDEANKELQELTQKASEQAKHLEAAETMLKEKENIIAQEQTFLREKESQREELQILVATLESESRALAEKEEYLKNAFDVVSFSCQHEEKTREKNTNEITENKIKILMLQEENNRIEEKLEQVIRAVEEIEQTLCSVKEKRASLSGDRNKEMARMETLTKEHEEKKDALHTISLKDVELRYQESALKERIETTYKIDTATFDFSALNRDEINFETLDEDIQKLKQRVESLGTVNLLAIEEHKELQDRYNFLVEQKTDLENAQRSLLEAIRKISRTTKQLFVDVFGQIQKNFQEYFKMLFGGGVAELVLVDEEHPLESGIDIVVRPPGKKLQNIGLLSGGEKALTAVALLFALFKVKPSPFCVLDEVDAPLDEANIDRFLSVVKQFLNTTQFIIVTHNRKTIGIADTLFGITMEEAGVSKLVSVRLRDVPITHRKGAKEGETHAFNKKEEKIDETIEEIFKEVK